MRETELRARVDRLLGGDHRTEDLARIFLWLRERSYGSTSVREVGDFVAHSAERDKGPVTHDMRSTFTFMRFRTECSMPGDPNINLGRLPLSAPEALRYNMSLMDNKFILEKTNMKQKEARNVLDTILRRVEIIDGKISIPPPYSPTEYSVLKLCFSYYTIRPVFDDKTLNADFRRLMIKNSLAKQSDTPSMSRAADFISLFSLTTMHNVNIRLNGNWTAECRMGTSEGNLAVLGEAPHVFPGQDRISISYPVYLTKLPAREYCDKSLSNNIDWKNFGIEVTAGPKLSRIG